MRSTGIIVAAIAVAFACSCDGTGATGDVLAEVVFPHGPDLAVDPGATDDVPADVGVEPDDVPADPGNGDDTFADPGPPDVTAQDDGGIFDPGAPDPGMPDPGGLDVVVTGSKTPGQYCEVSAECANGANCVAGEVTHAQCNPGCEVDTDCDKVAINANGQCTEVEGLPFKVCLWLCGSLMGGICPGDGQCDGAACR
jgi:hypothetical protein